MDVSGSGGLGVCASENGKVWVWDPDSGETLVHTHTPTHSNTKCRIERVGGSCDGRRDLSFLSLRSGHPDWGF